ncbi:MAG: hypothetical protein KDC05_08845 [Bacteroidales bacterium]|nr:hypothetical protein [Bacteroidales bacterium]
MSEIINWLLQGDVSIQYQVKRDLLHEDDKALQEKIAQQGWGAAYLSTRHPDGHWGMKFYQPKWTSSHYTLLDLRNLCISPENPPIRQSIRMILENEKGHDGGVNPAGSVNNSDVCINGMALNYACYFKTEEKLLHSVVDFILSQQLSDGGFNCRLNRSGAKHSSLHTTLSTVEGIHEYLQNGYTYRKSELKMACRQAEEFILIHRLFLSDRTGKIIHKDFLRFPWSSRWRYDILRALDYFRHADHPYDERMQPALDVLLKKQNKNGTWNTQAKHPGQEHFETEKAGVPGRMNTLRAMRVLQKYS